MRNLTKFTNSQTRYLFIIFLKVRLYALTLYPERADCTAATDTSGVTGCWQLSRKVQGNMRGGGWERAELLAAYKLQTTAVVQTERHQITWSRVTVASLPKIIGRCMRWDRRTI